MPTFTPVWDGPFWGFSWGSHSLPKINDKTQHNLLLYLFPVTEHFAFEEIIYKNLNNTSVTNPEKGRKQFSRRVASNTNHLFLRNAFHHSTSIGLCYKYHYSSLVVDSLLQISREYSLLTRRLMYWFIECWLCILNVASLTLSSLPVNNQITLPNFHLLHFVL